MKNTLQSVCFLGRYQQTYHILTWMTIGTFLLIITLLTACGGGTTTGQQSTATTITTPTASATQQLTPPTATPTPGPLKPTVPLTALRMLDNLHGWALTATEVLKTTDGGYTWEDASPANNPLKTSGAPDFMDAQHVWIAISPMQASGTLSGSIKILYTTDGAAHWQSSTIADTAAVATDRPHFANALDGWIEVGTGVAMSHESVDIFQTTNGGQTWLKVASAGPNSSSGLSFDGDKTGISFRDASNGWATAYTPATDHAWFYVTHDGGKSWQSQSLPTLPGLTNVEYATTPPVFLGNDGLLPVQVDTATLRGIDLYSTHDGGTHWAATSLTNFSSTNVYILDMQHAWASVGSSMYATSNGGQSWIKQGTAPNTIGDISAVDANNVWAIGYINDKTPLLFHTTDGGKSWQRIQYVIRE